MRARLALVVVLLVAAVGVSPGVPEGRTAATAANPTWAGTTIAIQVRPSGDARWNVTMRFSLPGEDDEGAFRRLADQFEAGEAGPDPDLYRRFVGRAEAETGRRMALRDVAREARLGNGTGRLSLSFTWTSFARRQGEQVVLGDVFRTGGGTWLPELDEGQTLVVHAPPDYAVRSASSGHRNGTFRYEGPRTFEGGVVNATFVPEGDPPPSETPTSTPATGTDASLDVPPAGVGVVGLVAALLVAVVLLRGRRIPDPWGGGAAGGGDGGDDGARPGGAAEAAGDGGTAAAAAAADEDDPFAGVDEDLLSDEERVEVLLEANGGRMKQADIVSETGWSNAKVSQLLSSMAEENRLDKLRIGRENLITLPDVDVGDVDDGE